MKKRIIALSLSAVLLLNACAQTTVTQEETTTQTQAVHMPAYKSELTYELPVSTVKVLVDRNGYGTDDDKRALFLGENLSGEFRIVQADTGDVVYTGEITKTAYDETSEQTVSRGDFNDFCEAGTYYIETDRIGRSYSFTIGDDGCESLLAALVAQEEHFSHEESAEGVCELGLGMHAMLLALQCHSVIFEDNQTMVPQLIDAADWLLTVQDEAGGSVYEDYEATAVYSGIMAMCANVFGKYDEKASKSYLAAAKRAWQWLSKQTAQTAQEAGAGCYAATQLFRAEGTQTYQKEALAYFENEDAAQRDNIYDLYDVIVYLSTERGTDRDVCTVLMQELVSNAEDICLSVRKDSFGVSERDVAANLYNMLLVCFVDYITPSSEYATVLENTLHYIEGRNESGQRLLGSDGTWTVEESGSIQEWNGVLLFMISDLLDDSDVAVLSE